MQPLNYQILPNSCWVTSMMNSIVLLYRNKNSVPPLVYRLVHSILTDDGVYSNGGAKKDFVTILKALESRTGMKIDLYEGEDVGPAIRGLHFRSQVVVCDIDAGSHSILLHRRNKKWIEGFDPDWDGVRKGHSKDGKYEELPDVGKREGGIVNVRIEQEYLIKTGSGKTGRFQMGRVDARVAVVMEK